MKIQNHRKKANWNEKIISQKNILYEKQFKNEVDKHNRELSNYSNQKKKVLDNLNKKKK